MMFLACRFLLKVIALTVGVAVLSISYSQVAQAAEPGPRIVRISVVTNGLAFDMEHGGEGMNHWRIDGSADLLNWDRYGGLRMLEGSGTTVIPMPLDSSMVYFGVMDNSVANVLTFPDQPYNYASILLPPHLRSPRELEDDNTPPDNPVTDPGARLGRVLFYDTKLSRNYTVSCASCHKQDEGFSDSDQFSAGFDGGVTGRNSMGLSNAKFYRRGHFFWDERADTLEDQVLMPIQDSVEMGMTLDDLEVRLQRYEYYQELFTDAYGDEAVTRDRIGKSLAQFVRSILSYRSKFDEGVASGFSNFTAEENLGRQIFNGPRGNCSACHSGPNFVGTRIENNGLEFPFVDRGVGAVTGNPGDDGKFKMSSLRNIEKTGPFMHDGRFATLEEVVDHYSRGVVANPNLGPPLTRRPRPGQPPGPLEPLRPNFTAQERAALVAFMKTLTDEALLTDPKYATPFRDE